MERTNNVRLIRLRRFVVEVVGEADPTNQQDIQRSIRRWHNRLANGSVPRSIFKKIGKDLFVDLDLFEVWLAGGASESKSQH